MAKQTPPSTGGPEGGDQKPPEAGATDAEFKEKE